MSGRCKNRSYFAQFGSERSRPSLSENVLTARPRGDNLKNALRFQKVEHLLHGGRRIQQAHPALAGARCIVVNALVPVTLKTFSPFSAPPPASFFAVSHPH